MISCLIPATGIAAKFTATDDLSKASGFTATDDLWTSPSTTGNAIRHDVSAKLPELIRMSNERNAAQNDRLKAATYVYPNFVENPEKVDNADRTPAPEFDKSLQMTRGSNNTPAVDMTFDGIGQADAPGGGLPPDTNGDVGIDHYIQYINTDWAVFEKTTGNLVGSVNEGNTFWAGFGGPCESNNAGDPIVLFDKTANVWVFSQFIASNNPNGSQCFAVSSGPDMTDPNVTFNRYQFDFVGEFNDYPHIGIWTDASGASSGYYMVTHQFDFSVNPPAFLGASFSVAERDQMIAGNPAQFVKFQAVSAFGASSFGALPAHLESAELPAAGSCAPFVHRRPDLDAYLIWSMCVDWANSNASALSPAFRVQANVPYGTGVNRVTQPAPAPVGSELDPFGGNTMYRASARAYPPASGLPTQLVINHVADAGNGLQGVRWVDFSLNYIDLIYKHGFENTPGESHALLEPTINDEGLFSPDLTSRWMGAISIDRSTNLGLGYSVASTSIFPSVRYTGRNQDDPKGEMRNEQNCVVGAGVQTFVDQTGRAGRWGDYSSMSVDPVDQCTFWMSVEYVATTGGANWENRVCSFKFPECGNPNLVLRSSSSSKVDVCTLDGAPQINLDLFALDGLSGNSTLSVQGLPGASGITFATNPVTTYPTHTTATLDNLAGAGTTNFSFSVIAQTAAPVLSRNVGFDVTVSSSITSAANLTAPANGSTGQLVRPVFVWDAVADALQYTVEIATDNGFANIIETGSSDIPTYTATSTLAATTQYFWRVTTSNNCGTGAISGVFNFTTGVPGACPAGTTPNVVFTDDIEGDVSDWSRPAAPIGTNTWAQSGVRLNSGAASFLSVDSDVSSDQYLVSPSIVLPSIAQAPLTLSYWNFQSMEVNSGTGDDACWDGSFLEISTDGGVNFTQVANANMLTDPYNGKITINAQNPSSGADAWCANAGQPLTGPQETVAVVDIDQYAGQTVQFRFRMSTDGNTGDEGWYIDDVDVQSCVPN
jgi:hypothetical protein